MVKSLFVLIKTMILLSACSVQKNELTVSAITSTSDDNSSYEIEQNSSLENAPKSPLIPMFDDNTKMYGYMDEYNSWVIPPMYDEVGISILENANQNLFPVKVNGKWGYVNNKNEFVIDPKLTTGFYFT